LGRKGKEGSIHVKSGGGPARTLQCLPICDLVKYENMWVVVKDSWIGLCKNLGKFLLQETFDTLFF